MGAFDAIIGYESVKRKLELTADVLANPLFYDPLGTKPPRAMLLYGKPGVGKTLMARCLIEASGRETVICRKNEPNSKFVSVIKEKFRQAAACAPSVLLLDDVDKFANEDEHHRDAEEYVTIQSCIDELAHNDIQVFVLATANDIHCLPHSLVRSGRLGNKIHISNPTNKDAEAILSHYLSRKKVVDDIDSAFLARIMSGHSCAELEEVVNIAGILAGFDRSDTITQDHFIRAVLQSVFHVPDPSGSEPATGLQEKREREYTAFHEAGHVVISEVLDPGSVTLVSIHGTPNGRTDGFTITYNSPNANIMRVQERTVLTSLGSKAALEQRFGIACCGVEADLANAFDVVKDLMGDVCTCGFNLYSYGNHNSEDLSTRIEQATVVEIEHYYRKAKEILSTNAEFLDTVAAQLLEKGLLTMFEIAELEKNQPLKLVTL